VGSIVLFVVSAALSMARIWREKESLRLAAKACAWAAVLVSLGVIVWHSSVRRNWLPLDDNFEALIWLGVILAIFVLYVQRTHPIGGLDWFVIPLVVLVLIGAAVFGSAKPHQYVPTAWSWVHRVSSFGGAIAFTIAGATGAMYLVANHRLRKKVATPGPKFGNLERLEHVTLMAVTLGFALLTVGAVTGVVWYLFDKRQPIGVPKIVLTCSVWVIYALVLHSPINPSFRGRKVAILSIVGCVLMFGLLIIVQFMPGK
jgi:ABC-type uncharacterized transport system permease subunit